MTPLRPYISFVVVARNDDYGGNFVGHTEVFLNNLLGLCERHKLPAELVIVEWNPPVDRPRLKEACAWPASHEYCPVRIIKVSHASHEQFTASQKVVMFEYLGKNVGVRRARGEYVLATNADLLYASELIEFFASQSLDHGSFYRIDRYNIEGTEVPARKSIDSQLAYCEKHYKLVQNRYGGDFIRGESFVSSRSLRRIATYLKNAILHFPYPTPYMNAAGDFFLMAKESWDKLRGYPEIPPYAYPDALCYMAMASGLRQVELRSPMRIYHQPHGRGGAETGRPRSDYERKKKQYRMMLKTKMPWLPNNEGWGLGGHKLSEEWITS